MDSVLINPDAPNLFNHGDGAREYAVAWDNISRCANGLHLLHFNLPIDYTTLDNCHQTEYSGVTADLIATRQSLVERTGELVETRGVVVERTNELVETREVVVERTNELIQTRAVVVERTLMLEQASSDLLSCRAKKGGLWQAGVNGDIQNYAAELAQIRKAFLKQTDELVQTRKILLERTDELVQTRQTLIERTNMLERANDDLLQRSNEFAEAQQALADRTEELKFYLSSPVYKRIFVKKMEKP
ncbi:hypothetical protein BLX41_07095 [Pseudomonas protegens]|nr:hypothetical protein BLX41_07095 [Pseudomonas protegens]